MRLVRLSILVVVWIATGCGGGKSSGSRPAVAGGPGGAPGGAGGAGTGGSGTISETPDAAGVSTPDPRPLPDATAGTTPDASMGAGGTAGGGGAVVDSGT